MSSASREPKPRRPSEDRREPKEPREREPRPPKEKRESSRTGEGRGERDRDRERRPRGEGHLAEPPRDKAFSNSPTSPARQDQESYLDSLIADCTDKRPEVAAPGHPRDMPKRPSSRADSRPKGADGESRRPRGEEPPRPEAPSGGPSPERRSRRTAEERAKKEERKERSTREPRPPEDVRPEETAPSAPRAPAAPAAPPPERSERKSRRPKEPTAEAPEVVDRHPQAPPVRPTNGRKVEAPHVEEEIEVHAPAPPAPKPAVEEEVDDIEYDEDFEEADEEEEQYVPQIKSSSPSPPTPSPDSTLNKVTFRPMSSQSLRAPTPPLGKESPMSASDIKKALQSENERMSRKSPMPTSPDMNRTKRGLMAEYESTMPKFNLGGSASPAQRSALSRLRDLRELQIPNKLGVEAGSLFQQKPMQDIQLFLAGKSLKYCKLKTTSCQTGDDDIEVGVNTEEVWTDDKEMQFPTLTSGQAAKSTGAEAQLLPFLRRVLPLFEASIVESNRRAGVVAPPPPDEQLGQALVRCTLPESFTSTFIGTWPSVADVSIVEKWYGADHALALYAWEEVVRPPPSEVVGLANFMRPIRSLVGLHPMVLGGSGGTSTRPARCLYSFCRLSSLALVNGRSHLIVAGSETGSLLVYDLRAKARSPAELQGQREGPPPNPDGDIAHFEGPIWLPSAFSTDVYALGPSQREATDLDRDVLSGAFGLDGDSSGVHESEICCVRCSDVAAGDALMFALDVSGVVSFWRVLELASVGVKLALQGSLALARGGGPHSHVLADFLGASYLCVHPQQQGEFVALSMAGVRQANRQRALTSNVADGPRNLELLRHADEEEGLLLPADPGASQPCSGAFNPFFPGLLLVAFAEGDLALFDCSLSVPVTHWASAVGKASPHISVAWSTRRPCVFFVKSGDTLDVWDLAEKTYVPVHSISLEGSVGGPPQPPSAVATCSELFVSSDGRPVVSVGSSVLLLGLPGQLTSPLQRLPRQAPVADRPLEELLLPGFEKDQVFPTLARHARHVDVPPLCMLERDVLRHIIAGINPMQAWV